MVAKEIFWKRQKRIRNEFPDVYQYDTLPNEFKVQVIQLWREELCQITGDPFEYFGKAVKTLRREFGVWRLPPTDQNAGQNYETELSNFFWTETDIEKALSAIELTFVEHSIINHDIPFLTNRQITGLNGAVDELNQRFREHGIGFQLESEKIIRIDSEFSHTEIIKPVLKLLNQKSPFLAGAEDEFLTAHAQYREGECKDALVWCNKALESTMKAICIKRKWMTRSDAQQATIAQLVRECVDAGLIPEFWEKKYRDGLTVMLKHGVPSGRNNLGSHGQGEEITEVQGHTVSYMLNMTGAAIKFLCDQEENLP